MFRKTIIAVTAILAVSLMAPTEASAWRGGFGGWHGGWGGWRGGWGGWGWGAAGLGIGLGLGLAATSPYWGGYGYGYPYGYGGYPYGYANYDGYGGCYLVRQQLWTSYGWRWRTVQVCG